jgi:hypothetical protein
MTLTRDRSAQTWYSSDALAASGLYCSLAVCITLSAFSLSASLTAIACAVDCAQQSAYTQDTSDKSNGLVSVDARALAQPEQVPQ